MRFQKRILEDSFFLDQQMGAFAIGGGLIASGLLHTTAISDGSAVEAAAMSLIVREAGGVAVDLHGKEILTFAFGEHKNKSDFLLPHGAVFACNINRINKFWHSHPTPEITRRRYIDIIKSKYSVRFCLFWGLIPCEIFYRYIYVRQAIML